MELSRDHITCADVRLRLPLKTWWAMLLVLPLSVRLICFIVTRTSLTPNMITIVGLLLRLITATLFLMATPSSFIFGALAYIAAYVCDCTDGAVARFTGKTSEFGRYLDHVSDLVGDILILFGLAWGQNLFLQPWIWAMVFMHIAESYISYLAGFALKNHAGALGNISVLSYFNRYRRWWFARNIKSFFSFPDYTALVFVFFPLFGAATLGLKIGFYFLLTIVSYTVLSTFVALHTGETRFP